MNWFFRNPFNIIVGVLILTLLIGGSAWALTASNFSKPNTPLVSELEEKGRIDTGQARSSRQTPITSGYHIRSVRGGLVFWRHKDLKKPIIVAWNKGGIIGIISQQHGHYTVCDIGDFMTGQFTVQYAPKPIAASRSQPGRIVETNAMVRWRCLTKLRR